MKRLLKICIILIFFILLVSPSTLAQEIPDGYKKIIQVYRDTLYSGEYNKDEYGDFQLKPMMAGEEVLHAIGYGLFDINKDGNPELLIGRMDNPEILAAIYTLEDGEPKQIGKSNSDIDYITIMDNWPEEPQLSETIIRTSLLQDEEGSSTIYKFYRLDGFI